MSTYLVTGAAGFIASRVCEVLLEAGHTVVGVDNLNDYYDIRLKDYRLSKLLGAGSRELGVDPKKSVYSGVGRVLRNAPDSGSQASALGTTRSTFEFHHLDIENLPALDALFAAHKFDAVFNLAARAGVRASLENPEIYRTTNILGEENVLKCQVKYGVRKQVLASSSSVYAGCPMPFTEDAALGTMQSPYAETKRQAEQLAKDYHLKHGLDVTVLRYFTVFGPAGRPDMAPLRFIKWIDEGTPITLYGDGSQARDFTYVDDIARGTVLAGQLYGGKLREQKASSFAGPSADKETGRSAQRGDGEAKLKAEGSETFSGSGPESSAFSFQPSLSAIGPATAEAFSDARPSYEVINLGGGNNPVTITSMIGMIEKALTEARSSKLSASSSENPQLSAFSSQVSVKAIINRLPPSPADMAATWADISKAKRLLSWSPQISAEDGFRRTVAWHLENKTWLKNIKV